MSDKIVHRAALLDEFGNASALCFVKPRAINPRLATWTVRDEAVTCAKCKHAMAVRP